jgi:hypothetical protein
MSMSDVPPGAIDIHPVFQAVFLHTARTAPWRSACSASRKEQACVNWNLRQAIAADSGTRQVRMPSARSDCIKELCGCLDGTVPWIDPYMVGPLTQTGEAARTKLLERIDAALIWAGHRQPPT